jgi:putative sigma-54 modulation protein
MEISITLKGIESVPKTVEDAIKSKISKVEKYFNKVQKADVVVSKQRGKYSVETTMHIAGRVLRAEGKGNLIDQALKNAADKLDRQVRKYKERIKDSYKNVREKEGNEELLEEPSTIVKVKAFPVKPMSVDEAILQLEMLDHDFFVFRDEETGEYNVLYRRKDGNYGLIKPKE